MGRAGNLSPLGLFNWDNTIFDLMQIPEALDREVLINNLLAQTAELEVLYPNPVVFKNLLGVWSQKNLDVWNRLYATTQYEYNPIENYNRYEDGTEGGSGTTTHSGTDTTTETNTHGGTDTLTRQITHGGTDTRTIDTDDGGTESTETHYENDLGGSDSTLNAGKSEKWIAGYDSNPIGEYDDGLVKQTREESNGTSTVQFGKTETANGTETVTFGKTVDTSDSMRYGKTENEHETKNYGETLSKTGGITHGEQITDSKQGSHTLHAHGNIGVTTTQNMIKQERQIDLFNVYDIIIEDFKMRFCILVY